MLTWTFSIGYCIINCVEVVCLVLNDLIKRLRSRGRRAPNGMPQLTHLCRFRMTAQEWQDLRALRKLVGVECSEGQLLRAVVACATADIFGAGFHATDVDVYPDAVVVTDQAVGGRRVFSR